MLVTGCSTGIGAALAKHAHQRGDAVIATARNPKSLSYLPDQPDVLKLALDVTSVEAVTTAITTAVKKFGRLDIIVNSAGFAVQGDTEAVPEASARAQVETNFWGAANVTKAALPILRDTNPPGKGGLIVQVSSMGGRIGMAGHGFYHARYACCRHVPR